MTVIAILSAALLCLLIENEAVSLGVLCVFAAFGLGKLLFWLEKNGAFHESKAQELTFTIPRRRGVTLQKIRRTYEEQGGLW